MPQQHAQMYGDKSTARCRQGALGRGILSPGTTIGVSYGAAAAGRGGHRALTITRRGVYRHSRFTWICLLTADFLINQR
jgi:hypothetical protein